MDSRTSVRNRGSQAQELNAAEADLQGTQKELDAAKEYFEKLRTGAGQGSSETLNL